MPRARVMACSVVMPLSALGGCSSNHHEAAPSRPATPQSAPASSEVAPSTPSQTSTDETPASAPSAPCKRGGCSGELCVDPSDSSSPGFSACVYRSEWACYDRARCERDASGHCGWVQSPELEACLKDKAQK